MCLLPCIYSVAATKLQHSQQLADMYRLYRLYRLARACAPLSCRKTQITTSQKPLIDHFEFTHMYPKMRHVPPVPFLGCSVPARCRFGTAFDQ